MCDESCSHHNPSQTQSRRHNNFIRMEELVIDFVPERETKS